jgi:K+-sensing histidine kinase KdpD
VAGLRRRKGDPQPTQPASVLLASTGESTIPNEAIRAAVAAAAGQAVAVVTIARVYGSSLGLPNPGLMPSRAELAAQRKNIESAVAAIERRGAKAWGQIAVTRHASRTIARAAKARGAQRVIVVRPAQPRWRRVVEGDVVREVSRRLGPDVVVEAFPTSPVSR